VNGRLNQQLQMHFRMASTLPPCLSLFWMNEVAPQNERHKAERLLEGGELLEEISSPVAPT